MKSVALALAAASALSMSFAAFAQTDATPTRVKYAPKCSNSNKPDMIRPEPTMRLIQATFRPRRRGYRLLPEPRMAACPPTHRRPARALSFAPPLPKR
jgi:hypothetical protein